MNILLYKSNIDIVVLNHEEMKMFDTRKYRNTVKYPQRADYTVVETVTSKGITSANATAEVKFFDKQKYDEARKEYLDENCRIWENFVTDLKVCLAIYNNPKADLLIEKARSNTDGSFQEVADWCEEMVDLIE